MDVPPPRPRVIARPWSTTPEMLRSLVPQLKGYTVLLDEDQCRWVSKADGVLMPSQSFGPRSGRSRSETLEAALVALWARAGQDRPLDTIVENIEPTWWEGILDAREERPRKWARRS